MRKITEQMQKAFEMEITWKKSNTEVVVYPDFTTRVFLHGNMIAIKENGLITFSSCGWYSNTTKERLNALIPEGYAIAQRSYNWYVMNREGLYIKWFDGITASQIENGEYKPLKEVQ